LITRQAYSEVPARVEYSLTELGETLCPLMHTLRDWAEANIDRVLTARSRYNPARSDSNAHGPRGKPGQ
jgi:DNA-binding HxlR family transcriptional regulator